MERWREGPRGGWRDERRDWKMDAVTEGWEQEWRDGCSDR